MSRKLLKRGLSPLVGLPSQRNTLKVTELAHRMRVELNLESRLLLLVAGVLFGPGLATLLATYPERFAEMPLLIGIVLGMACVGMTAFLIRTMFRRPRIDVLTHGLIMGRDPKIEIPLAEIEQVRIDTDVYSNPPRVYVDNAVLVIRTAEGEVRLCVSPDFSLVERVARRIADLAGLEVLGEGMKQ